MEWVDINDKIPEKDGRYLVYTPHLICTVWDAYWSVTDKTWGRDFNRTDYVTHWMELPPPPSPATSYDSING